MAMLTCYGWLRILIGDSREEKQQKTDTLSGTSIKTYGETRKLIKLMTAWPGDIG